MYSSYILCSYLCVICTSARFYEGFSVCASVLGDGLSVCHHRRSQRDAASYGSQLRWYSKASAPHVSLRQYSYSRLQAIGSKTSIICPPFRAIGYIYEYRGTEYIDASLIIDQQQRRQAADGFVIDDLSALGKTAAGFNAFCNPVRFARRQDLGKQSRGHRRAKSRRQAVPRRVIERK